MSGIAAHWPDGQVRESAVAEETGAAGETGLAAGSRAGYGSQPGSARRSKDAGMTDRRRGGRVIVGRSRGLRAASSPVATV